ncbi:LPS assembly lipoprotein LptE [Candidatus Neptunochlamydia vexilliferae]|uniref:LPS assembly lipoprotein LptE n=1 Tax=Candidatus Neptunichlamydia vexilliferae TaxID=1651774 RepID=UPI0018917A9B|nr:LPS assembly lipoprotein LptE [Candidatus Neptunochlamydia vexilliferae]
MDPLFHHSLVSKNLPLSYGQWYRFLEIKLWQKPGRSFSKKLLGLIASFSLTLAGCGYHVDDQSGGPTLSVPYFKGDKDGALTDAVIKGLATSGNFNYATSGGTLVLEGRVTSDTSHHIGYQYDRRPVSGERVRRLIPNEGRREITVQLTLIDSRTQKVVHGPIQVSAYSDYDFVDSDSLQDTSFIDRCGVRTPVLFFSLGQLDSVDGAKAAAATPIHARLARKIVEGLSNLSYSDPNG